MRCPCKGRAILTFLLQNLLFVKFLFVVFRQNGSKTKISRTKTSSEGKFCVMGSFKQSARGQNNAQVFKSNIFSVKGRVQ